MNMPQPMYLNCCNIINEKLNRSYVTESKISMIKPAKECSMNNSSAINNVTASFDGTWQRRGFSSMNGVTAIANVKCINIKILTKTCKQYQYWKCKKDIMNMNVGKQNTIAL